MRSIIYRIKAAFRHIPGKWKSRYDLLRNEEIKAELQPHPLSFLDHHSPFIYLFALGLGLGYLFNAVTGWVSFEEFLGYAAGIVAIRMVIWAIALIAFGVAVSVVLIRWTVLFIFVFIIAGALSMTLQAPEVGTNPFFLPLYSIITAIVGMAFVDLYRRTHTYIITDLRLILKAGILRKSERTVRFENVTDLEASQGIIGRIFGFGNIVPVTASGIGTGAEEAFAGGGVGATTKEGTVGGGVFAGGSREVTVARARSYAEFHGVYPFRKVKILIHQLLQEHSLVYYAKEQRDLLKDMRDMMAVREEPDHYYAHE
ncbi:MAG: PH domain-containing protein [Thermoplasmata archaeon]